MILLHDLLNRKDEITRTRFVETFSARQIDYQELIIDGQKMKMEEVEQ